MSSLTLIKWKDDNGEIQNFNLGDKVSSKWRKFGHRMKLENNKLDGWEGQFHGDVTRCWGEVMQHWLDMGGTDEYPETWEELYKMLEDVELGGVAKKLKRAVDAAIQK